MQKTSCLRDSCECAPRRALRACAPGFCGECASECRRCGRAGDARDAPDVALHLARSPHFALRSYFVLVKSDFTLRRYNDPDEMEKTLKKAPRVFRLSEIEYIAQVRVRAPCCTPAAQRAARVGSCARALGGKYVFSLAPARAAGHACCVSATVDLASPPLLSRTFLRDFSSA
jgi:hypothetical protein